MILGMSHTHTHIMGVSPLTCIFPEAVITNLTHSFTVLAHNVLQSQRSLVIVRYGWVWDVTGVHGLALYYRHFVHSDSLCIDFEILCVHYQ